MKQPCCGPADDDAVDHATFTAAYSDDVGTDVDHFVDSLKDDWQREACANLLEDIRKSACLGEHIKWGHPYFDYEGSAVLKWFCAKKWINVYFFRGRELLDPHALFEASDNQLMLTIKVRAANDLDRNAFREMVRAAALLAGEAP